MIVKYSNPNYSGTKKEEVQTKRGTEMLLQRPLAIETLNVSMTAAGVSSFAEYTWAPRFAVWDTVFPVLLFVFFFPLSFSFSGKMLFLRFFDNILLFSRNFTRAIGSKEGSPK